MKKTTHLLLIAVSILATTSSTYATTNNINDMMNALVNKIETYKKPKTVKKQRISAKGKRLPFPINYNVLLSNQNCSQVINKKSYTSCYTYSAKLSKIVIYDLSGNSLRSGYIQRKNDYNAFYEEKLIPRKYRATLEDYVGSKFDRGHQRSYASSAYSQKIINETYSLLNVAPQTKKLNREVWVKAEKYERYMARKFGKVRVLNISDFRGATKRIGRRGVLVPNGFYKVITAPNFKKCFYFRNINNFSSDTLRNFEIDCTKIRY